jgi:hypothetical protein
MVIKNQPINQSEGKRQISQILTLLSMSHAIIMEGGGQDHNDDSDHEG